MSEKTEGLFHKYDVRRVDGKPVEWAFVLEDKDPLSVVALRAYAEAARQAGYVPLAADLFHQANALAERHNAYEPHRCGRPELDRRDPACEP